MVFPFLPFGLRFRIKWFISAVPRILRASARDWTSPMWTFQNGSKYLGFIFRRSVWKKICPRGLHAHHDIADPPPTQGIAGNVNYRSGNWPHHKHPHPQMQTDQRSEAVSWEYSLFFFLTICLVSTVMVGRHGIKRTTPVMVCEYHRTKIGHRD